MEQMLLSYIPFKETVTAIKMLNKNMKTVFHWTNGLINFFVIIARVL